MSDDTNPYESPKADESREPVSENRPGPDQMSGRRAYNVVSDTVTGANLRLKDNVFQALAIVVCLALGALIGALLVKDRLPGALAGAFIGLLVGLLGSGLFLMIFRAVMHLRGRHD